MHKIILIIWWIIHITRLNMKTFSLMILIINKEALSEMKINSFVWIIKTYFLAYIVIWEIAICSRNLSTLASFHLQSCGIMTQQVGDIIFSISVIFILCLQLGTIFQFVALSVIQSVKEGLILGNKKEKRWWELDIETKNRKEEPAHAKKRVIDRLTEIISEI